MSDNFFAWENLAEKKLAYIRAQKQAQEDYKLFWAQEAQRLSWANKFTHVHDNKFIGGQWFLDGKLNASFNCLDRHIKTGWGEKTALIYEKESGEIEKYSYNKLHELTCSIATILHNNNIQKGDRVAIYMPLSPEGIASMLACARVGAIHTVIFAGFSKTALSQRIADSRAKIIITAKCILRKNRLIPLRQTVLEILKNPEFKFVEKIISFNSNQETPVSREIFFEYQKSWPSCVKNPEGFDAQHPLFILYTSGTTGAPKGISHATGGYLVQAVSTSKWVFDFNDKDIFWCSADIGWITGHTYLTYGPLALGATCFIYDGALNYPNSSRVYEIINNHKISILYTAPTAIRMFMQAGEEYINNNKLDTIRLLGSVGEPINPEAWNWYRRVFGQNNCPIIDSWWQTETGAMMITPIPNIHAQKPGFATKPFLGIDAQVVDISGKECSKNQDGLLVIKKPWPGLARGIWNDYERFEKTYFSQIPNYYFTGDGAKKDKDQDFCISGRIDDVVNISGHRLGTAEIESILVEHPAVAEAAVVGSKDDITGEKLVAFVILMSGAQKSQELIYELKQQVKNTIGSFACPKEVRLVSGLPKTRSGKIMRRLLRTIACGEKIHADISTLEDKNLLAELQDQ